MSGMEIIFISIVEIRRTAKLRFLKSAVQHGKMRRFVNRTEIYSCYLACQRFNIDVIQDFFLLRKRVNLFLVVFADHLQWIEMFAIRRSDGNELERKFLPARFASHVQHRLLWLCNLMGS